MSAAEELCAQLSSARQRFLSSAASISEAVARRRPDDDEWSVIEVLAHMIDVDDYYLGQALLLRDQPRPAFNYFDDDTWKRRHPSPDGFELADVLRRLDASHKRVLTAASALTEEELARRGIHPRRIPYTVRDVLLRLPAHDDNHRRQIEDIRSRI
jgi:uncharacterized damage-inducible protein DinB